MAHILIIDDDESIRYSLSRMVGRMGHTCTCTATLREGIDQASSERVDVVFLDVRMPDGSGLDLLPAIRQTSSSPEVIIITGYGDPDGAELALKSGAWDYVEKGCSIKEMSLPLLRALQYREERSTRGRTTSIVSLKREGIVGSSARLMACLDLVASASGSDANVLITGETGTGKELFARAIHQNSPRAKKSFVVVDCAALPETLVESLLFGHERGAFTGADKAREGLIRQADGGTLFLDEVGELPMSLQKAFLRVLQERRFRPLGSSQEIESNFRLVAATHRDLDLMTQQGAFREDLLFRLKAFTIDLPPLKGRTEDIKELARYHMDQFCERYGLAPKGFSPEFIETLVVYPWPGNVRELVNALDRSLIAARLDPTLFPAHLPMDIRVEVARTSLSCKPFAEEEKDEGPVPVLPRLRDFREALLTQAEKQYLQDLMTFCKGNMDKACEISGVSLSRMYALLQKHNTPRFG
ncbi:MAG: sigma-54-dependent Fis family transcriptional regulator [Syntrophobacteraceae bacterium]|nr:sigma-54-dependent Fis family transcriptional regulator [Syntrophobacteraceae bacterium]